MLAGLLGSLTIRRRRVWFRFTPDGAGSAVSAGGLARNEYAGFVDEFDRLVAAAGGPPRTRPATDHTTSQQPGAEGVGRAQTTGAEGAARARGKD
jgi:cytochrome c biogenesis protein